LNRYPHRDVIDVWQIQALGENSRFKEILSTEELERSSRFYSSQYSIRWRYFHCAMRDILSRYTGCKPRELSFAVIARDKPVLVDFPGVFYNLSHSTDRALLAVTSIAPVGVDIEFNRGLADTQALIERYFSAREQHTLAQLPEEEISTAFYRVWTRKEAVIKAHGHGLGIALDKFDVPCGALPAWQPTRIRETAITRPYFQVQEVPTAVGFSGAVALHASQTKPAVLHSLQYIEYMGDSTSPP
jgi:4'-phosphopantetheinyl transferase